MPNKVMVVVGGNRGNGAAISRMAAARGWTVLFTYSSQDSEATALEAEIASKGGRAIAWKCDVSHEEDIEALFQEARRRGGTDALVYSSGITGSASRLAEASSATLRQVIDINLVGAMLCAREAVRTMADGGGSITFISSRAADRGSAGEYVWYAASKGGLNSLCVGLSREVASLDIRVNCVSPGPVATGMLSAERQEKGAAAVPMQRVATPEEIAEAVLFLASDAASYVTGANLPVAGGA